MVKMQALQFRLLVFPTKSSYRFDRRNTLLRNVTSFTIALNLCRRVFTNCLGEVRDNHTLLVKLYVLSSNADVGDVTNTHNFGNIPLTSLLPEGSLLETKLPAPKTFANSRQSQ